jgi:hypothetical protein
VRNGQSGSQAAGGKQVMAKIIAVFFLIVGGAAVVIGWSIGQAWILEHVWAWYMVRFGLPRLTLGQCFVFSYAFALLVQSGASAARGNKSDDSPWATIAGNLFAWLLLLGFAWWLR